MTNSNNSPDRPGHTSFPPLQDSSSPPATTEGSPTNSKPSPDQNTSQSTAVQQSHLEVLQTSANDLSLPPQDSSDAHSPEQSNQPHPQTPMTFTAQAQPEQKPHLRGGCDDECCDVCCCSYRRQGPAPQPLYHKLWYGAPTARQK